MAGKSFSLDLDKARTFMVILGSLAAISAAIAAYIDYRIDFKVKPVQQIIMDHEESEGHPATIKKIDDLTENVNKMHDDLAYIRGRIDQQWGKKSNSSP